MPYYQTADTNTTELDQDDNFEEHQPEENNNDAQPTVKRPKMDQLVTIKCYCVKRMVIGQGTTEKAAKQAAAARMIRLINKGQEKLGAPPAGADSASKATFQSDALQNWTGPGSATYQPNGNEIKLFNNGLNSEHSCYKTQNQLNSVEKLYIACAHFKLNLPVFTDYEHVNIQGHVRSTLTLNLNIIPGQKSDLVRASELHEKEKSEDDANEESDGPQAIPNVSITRSHFGLKPAKLSCADEALQILSKTYPNFEAAFLKYQQETEFKGENVFGYSKERLLVYQEPKPMPIRTQRQFSGGPANFNNQNPNHNQNFNHNHNNSMAAQSNDPNSNLGIGAFPHANRGQFKVNAYNPRHQVDYNLQGNRGGYRGNYRGNYKGNNFNPNYHLQFRGRGYTPRPYVPRGNYQNNSNNFLNR